MELISNDKQQVYYWVDDLKQQVSPAFDYEEDAIQWKDRKDQEREDQERAIRQSVHWPFPTPANRP